jgi:hypothetical protein
MNKVKTSVAEMFIDDDDILHIKILPNAQITIEAVKECFSVTLELLSGKKALILFDGSEKYQLTEEAKAFSASKAVTETRIAIAFVTNSISNKVMFNLYLNVYKPAVPTKMFSSQKEGLDWLKTFYVMPGDKFIGKKKK